nr:hypothetical protein [Psychrobacter sp. JCM 18901]
MSAQQPNKIPVQQVDLDATKHRVHPRFVTGFYQNIRVITMYALLAAFFYFCHGCAIMIDKQYGLMCHRSITIFLA